MRGLGLLVSAGLLAGAAAPGNQAADQQAISSDINQFVNGWNHHDAGKMASIWSPSGTMLNPDGREATGHDEVLALFKGEQASVMKHSSVAVESPSIRWIKPDVALVDTTFTVDKLIGMDGRERPPIKGHMSMLMTKNGDRWQVTDARAFNFTPQPEARPAPVGVGPPGP